jgi:hypothetical protein
MASIVSAGTTSGTALNMSGDTSGVLQLASNNGTTAVTIDTSQNVGIVNTSPVSYFSSARNLVVGTTSGNNGITILGGSAATAVLAFGYATGTAAGDGSNRAKVYYDGPSDTLRMSAGGSLMSGPQFVLDASGNLLVGTTSALSQTGRATFVNSGNALVTQVGNSSTAYQSTNTSGTGAYYAAIWSNNGNTFSTCGTIQVSGSNTSYNTSSDYRLKEDVQPMTGALAKVALLKPVTYKWKSDGTESEGFIAHELAEICPHAVSGKKDALKEDGSIMPQGIDTSFLVATLTAAIQELKAINDTQAETLTQQTEAINALTARVVALESKGA